MKDISTLIYTSVLAPGYGADIIKSIATKARVANARHDITGILAFDGENFAQLVEGPSRSIHQLYANLAGDCRHTVLTVVFSEPTQRRRFPNWRLGYLVVNDATRDLAHMSRTISDAAGAVFDLAVRDLDTGIGEALPKDKTAEP